MKRQKDKGKEKEKVNKPSESQVQAYKSALFKTPEQLKAEIMAKTPNEKKLREDAYKASEKTNQSNEFLYPYIQLSIEWICPVENKYSHLTPNEIKNFYLREDANPFLHPKCYQYYFSILNMTKSVDFDSTARGNEWAFSKAFIKQVITPAQWQGDFYSFREVSKEKRTVDKPWFNYFDYIKAWSGAFCYENRKTKHSWFLQFRDFDPTNIPQWFLLWFSDWGFNPIILPDDIRTVFDKFCEINESMKNKELMFAVLYKIPWILKWDITVKMVPIKKFEVLQCNIPYMGRRVLIKWWDKFDFFKDSVFSDKGIINLEPAKPPPQPKRNLADILGELIQNSPKEDLKDLKRYLKTQLFDESEEEEEDTEKISEENLASFFATTSHHSDDIMQDAQSP